MGHFDQADHDLAQRGSNLALGRAQRGKRFRCVFRHILEFHDQVLDHGRFDAGMAEEAQAIVAQLKNQPARRPRRPPAPRLRPAAPGGRACRRRPGTLRQMAVQRARDGAPGPLHREAQRRVVGAAAGGAWSACSPDTDADDRQPAVEEIARQAQLRPEAGYQVAADDAVRPGAEEHQPGKLFCARRHRSARRERPQ